VGTIYVGKVRGASACNRVHRDRLSAPDRHLRTSGRAQNTQLNDAPASHRASFSEGSRARAVIKDPIGPSGARLRPRFRSPAVVVVSPDPHIGISQRIHRERQLLGRTQLFPPTRRGIHIAPPWGDRHRRGAAGDIEYLKKSGTASPRPRAHGARADAALPGLSLAAEVLRDIQGERQANHHRLARKTVQKLQDSPSSTFQGARKLEHYTASGARSLPTVETNRANEARRVELKAGLPHPEQRGDDYIDVNTALRGHP